MRTYMALGAAVIFWGLSFVATKIALEALPPFTLIFARFTAASCFFAALLYRRGLPRFSGSDHGRLFLLALFEPGLYFTCETLGLQYTSAPKAALIIATIPVVVTIGAFLFLGEKPRPVAMLGAGLSMVGVFILVTGEPRGGETLRGHLLGDLLIFGAVIAAALYMLLARNLGRRHSAFEITGMQTLYGALFYTPTFLWELPGVQWAAVGLRPLAALVYLTLCATITAFLCYNFALTRIEASRAAVFINCIPVVTAIGAWILLGERLTRVQNAGGLLVLLAVFLTTLPTKKASPGIGAPPPRLDQL